jgi:anti-anti-sigma regulatory factor
MSNVDALDDALRVALSDETTSCLLDLSEVTFLDSTVIRSLVHWSKEAQVSEREALAIAVGGSETPAARILGLVDLLKRLPVFPSRDVARAALEHGRLPRKARPLGWLTDRELATERDDAQTGIDAAQRRLNDAVEEQEKRSRE